MCVAATCIGREPEALDRALRREHDPLLRTATNTSMLSVHIAARVDEAPPSSMNAGPAPCSMRSVDTSNATSATSRRRIAATPKQAAHAILPATSAHPRHRSEHSAPNRFEPPPRSVFPQPGCSSRDSPVMRFVSRSRAVAYVRSLEMHPTAPFAPRAVVADSGATRRRRLLGQIAEDERSRVAFLLDRFESP